MKTFATIPTRVVRRSVIRSLVLVLAMAWALVPSSSWAQAGVTSLGNDFWIGMMPNYLGPAQNIRVFVASGTENDIHCDFYGGSAQPADTRTLHCKANDVQSFYQYSTALAEERIPEKIEYKAIHVYAKNPFAVYAISNSGATTDSYLGIPTQALGTEYIADCYYDDNYGAPSDPLAGEFLVVAAYDDTHITIHDVHTTTRSDFSGTVAHDKGSTWDFTLQKGQTYLVQSTGLGIGDEDLTGTYVTGDKPFGFISGHQRCSVPIGAPNNSKDHICEMIPSVDRWGTMYYDMPMAGRTLCGDYIRLIAGEDNVMIAENGKRVAQLGKKGDFVDRELVLEPVVYQAVDASGNPSGKKFLTVQMSYTDYFNGDQGKGDPFSIVMTPREQFQKRLLFRCPSQDANNPISGSNSYLHYVTFVCQKDSINFIRINGKRITSYQSAGAADIPGTSNPAMAAYRIKGLASDKAYLAECGAPFGAYIYGFTDVESYGHPAGMALRIVTPDPIAPAEVRDSSCGTFHVQLQELRHQKPAGNYDFEDSRISEVSLITDPGDLRWDKPSYNFDFKLEGYKKADFVPGDSIAVITLTIQDLTKDGYAALWATDRAGNDTLYEYYYYAPKVSITPNENPYMYKGVTVGKDSCRTYVFHNVGQSDLAVNTIRALDSAKAGKFTVTPTTVNATLKPGDSLTFSICFNPTDTVVSDDTVIVQTECVPFPYPVEGIGATPIILADNLDFGGVSVGDTACQDLKIKNIGNAPLVIDKNWILKNQTHFFFKDGSILPVTIMPGETHTFNFCYAPDGPHADSGLQNWGTNILPPFAHMKKDSSILSGYGLQPGLNWDRASEGYTVECSDTLMQRVFLVNPSSGTSGTSITINKVQIEGPDAAEFTIVDNQKHYLPLENTPPWPLGVDEKIWIDITFKPDLTKGYRPRNAKIVAYGVDAANKPYQPELNLMATVRHSQIRISPSGHDFGSTTVGTALSTDFWLHNDGDTDLVLSTVTVGGGNYAVSGYTVGQRIAPGDSIKVTVTGSSVAGDMAGTLTANGNTGCDTSRNVPLTAFGSSNGVAGTGAAYGDVYVCKDGTALIKASNYGTTGQILQSIEIIDSNGSTGANEYAFADGSQKLVLNLNYDGGESHEYPVTFKPIVNGGKTAYVLYTWVDTTATPDTLIYRLAPLTGNPLFYPTVISVHKDYGDQVYSAHTGDVLSVPVQMKVAFDPKANVFGMSFTVRYRRDEFSYQSMDLANGLNLTGTPTIAPDPSDAKFEILSATATSGSPITALDTVAHVLLRYNIALDSTTSILVQNVSFTDNTGTSPCWVVADTIGGTFVGLDYCGNSTIRNVMAGNPIYSIRKVTPNPVTSKARIDYDVRVNNAPMTIEVFDVLGNKVLTAVDGRIHAKGAYSAQIDASKLGSGTYTVRTSSMGFVESQQIVIQK